MTFYHGTTTAAHIKDKILPPSETGNKRETWRAGQNSIVFFTTSLRSAHRYAEKACGTLGGNPIVYRVKPEGWFSQLRNNEYIAEAAAITGVQE